MDGFDNNLGKVEGEVFDAFGLELLALQGFLKRVPTLVRSPACPHARTEVKANIKEWRTRGRGGGGGSGCG